MDGWINHSHLSVNLFNLSVLTEVYVFFFGLLKSNISAGDRDVRKGCRKDRKFGKP